MIFSVKVEDHTYQVEIQDTRSRPIVVIVEGERFEVWPEQEEGTKAAAIPPKSPVPRAKPLPKANPSLNGKTNAVYAPIPGVIQAISVKPGDAVKAGQELCVLEAMKMKNIIKATRAGQIEAVHIRVGQQVKHHDTLMTYAE